jgi:hypothetical protein
MMTRRGLWPVAYIAAAAAFLAAVTGLVKYGAYSASEAIYIVTGLVLAAYTIETYRLRREAQRQTELQGRPFLSVICEWLPESLRTHSPAVHVVNLGHGLARNIVIGDVIPNWSMELRGLRVTHLAPQERVTAPWRVWVKVTREDPIGEVPSTEHTRIAAQAILENSVTIALTYTSIVGQQYRTTIRVERGVAEIASDERL